jgi:hypothetical protein
MEIYLQDGALQPLDGKLTAVPFAETQLYAVLPEAHPAAQNEQIRLLDLENKIPN